jgi:hypothetical protein
MHAYGRRRRCILCGCTAYITSSQAAAAPSMAVLHSHSSSTQCGTGHSTSPSHLQLVEIAHSESCASTRERILAEQSTSPEPSFARDDENALEIGPPLTKLRLPESIRHEPCQDCRTEHHQQPCSPPDSGIGRILRTAPHLERHDFHRRGRVGPHRSPLNGVSLKLPDSRMATRLQAVVIRSRAYSGQCHVRSADR